MSIRQHSGTFAGTVTGQALSEAITALKLESELSPRRGNSFGLMEGMTLSATAAGVRVKLERTLLVYLIEVAVADPALHVVAWHLDDIGTYLRYNGMTT